MMKIFFIYGLIIVCLFIAIGFTFADDSVSTRPVQDNIIERIGVAGPLKFNKTSFNLAWTAKPNDTYYAQEYLPEGENLETFNQMLSIHLFVKDIKPEDAAQQKAIELTTNRKKGDPFKQYAIMKSPDGNKFIIDFLVGESENNAMTLIEFNIYRYEQINLDDKKALLVYMYHSRSYGADTRRFMNELKDIRKKCLNEMTSIEIPVITIENN